MDNEPENGCRTVQESLETHTPGIVITDSNMPDMDGVQMAENIQHINPDTKFIVLTGDTEETDLDKSSKKKIRASACYKKPVTLQEIFAAIDQRSGEIGRLTRFYPKTPRRCQKGRSGAFTEPLVRTGRGIEGTRLFRGGTSSVGVVRRPIARGFGEVPPRPQPAFSG